MTAKSRHHETVGSSIFFFFFFFGEEIITNVANVVPVVNAGTGCRHKYKKKTRFGETQRLCVLLNIVSFKFKSYESLNSNVVTSNDRLAIFFVIFSRSAVAKFPALSSS